MAKFVEGYFRPAAMDQVFFDNYRSDRLPTISTMVQKGFYQGLLARAVANFNPFYAGVYGFLRGTLDVPLAKFQEFLFEEFDCEMREIRREPALKAIYIAFNFFATVTALYSICKIGELVYWGGKSLVGRADYRPFGILDLLKIEGMFVLFTVGIDLGFKGLQHVLTHRGSSSSERYYHEDVPFDSYD